MPLRFEYAFGKEGQHVVSLIADTDPAKDVLAADNEQHLVVDVVKDLPILLVDGDQRTSPDSSAFFLERSFSKSAVPYPAFKASMLVRTERAGARGRTASGGCADRSRDGVVCR